MRELRGEVLSARPRHQPRHPLITPAGRPLHQSLLEVFPSPVIIGWPARGSHGFTGNEGTAGHAAGGEAVL